MSIEWGQFEEENWVQEQARIEHRILFTGWLPPCMQGEREFCFDCPVEPVPHCPIEFNYEYRSYLLWLHERYVAKERKRLKQIEVLGGILKKHKLPLHWEVLAVLAMREAPQLFDSANTVRGIVFFNPHLFHQEGGGVFTLA